MISGTYIFEFKYISLIKSVDFFENKELVLKENAEKKSNIILKEKYSIEKIEYFLTTSDFSKIFIKFQDCKINFFKKRPEK